MRLLAILVFALALGACSYAQAEQSAPEYRAISPETAKAMMDADSVIILDVRTQEEYDEGHIEGAMLIPDFEVAKRAAELLPDKNAVILVYCRAGRRSERAARILVDMGYTAVYDFGGIMDWPYEIVTGPQALS
jgi:rhodanese-related sulfurtransferase